jgi:Uma2 family endonuclease
MQEATRLITAEEFEHWPEEEGKTELVDGRVVSMSPVGPGHGWVVGQMLVLLHQHVRPRNLGMVGPEIGVTLRRNPDTVRAPDIAFLRRDRIPEVLPKGFWKGPPDLAVEVLSPDDRPGEMRRKVSDYLSSGVPCVVVIDPEARTIVVSRPAGTVALASGDTLDLDDVIEGFRCAVDDVFAF